MSSGSYSLNWQKSWQIICKHKLVIIYIFFAILLFTIFSTNRKPPVYLATAKVKLGETKILFDVIYGDNFGSRDVFLNNQVRKIQNIQIMREVVKRLALVPEWATEEVFERSPSALLGKVRARREEFTNIIRIDAISESPKEAMDLANTIVQVYVDESLKERARKIRNLRRLVEGQLAKLRTESGNLNGSLKRWREALVTARILELEQKPQVSIVELATLPEFPIRPRKARNVVMAVLVGLPVAVSFAFLLERLDTRSFSGKSVVSN